MQSNSTDPTAPISTKHPGVSRRPRKDGSNGYRYWRGGNSPYSETFPTLQACLDAQADFRLKKKKGAPQLVQRRVTFEECAAEWLEDAKRRLRPNTVSEYESYLRRLLLPKLGDRLINSITAEDIAELIRELEARTVNGKPISSSAVANALKPLGGYNRKDRSHTGVFGWAVFRRYVAAESNPMMQLPAGYRPSCTATREHREWTAADVSRVIEVAYQLDARSEARCSYAVLTEFLIRTGARIGEALGAQFGDIDFEAGVFTVKRQRTKTGRLSEPKTKKALRRIPIEDGLLRKLATRSLELGAESTTPLFAQTKDGQPPTATNYRRRHWLKVVEKAGLSDGPKVTPHDLRHAFTSQLHDLGVSSTDLAEVLGHTSAAVTEGIYLHVFDRASHEERIRTAMEQAAA